MLCAKSRHSGRFWILLLVGKGAQVRGASPVKLPRRESLHLAAGAAALPITARITCSRRSRNRLQVESRFRLYVSRNAKKAQPVLSNGCESIRQITRRPGLAANLSAIANVISTSAAMACADYAGTEA